MAKFQDLTGRRFGKLTVVKRIENYISPKGARQTRWECLCDCGNITNCRTMELNSGAKKSCGCSKSEFCSLINRKTNRYDIDNYNYGIGYTSKGERFYFDKEDFQKINSYCWYIDNYGYVVTDSHKYHGVKNKKNLRMHRIIMDYWDNKLDIDHINNNKFDNRKSNLRLVTRSQNFMNKDKQSNNTSGVTGVYWDKSRNKWMAAIQVNGKQINLGRYDNKKDAVVARKHAENKYFGEYSFDNSQLISSEVASNA